MPDTDIRVLLADDHPILNRGLAREISETPGLTLVATAFDGDEALALVRKHTPDVAVLDIDMPKLNGLDVLGLVKQMNICTQVLMLTGSVEEDLVYAAISGGASGYLLKTTDWPDIVKAIFDVASGKTVVDPSLHGTMAGALQNRRALEDSGFSPRERTVIALTAHDLTAKAIGVRMDISERMVKKHLSAIYRKLNVASKHAAVAEAARRGIIK